MDKKKLLVGILVALMIGVTSASATGPSYMWGEWQGDKWVQGFDDQTTHEMNKYPDRESKDLSLLEQMLCLTYVGQDCAVAFDETGRLRFKNDLSI